MINRRQILALAQPVAIFGRLLPGNVDDRQPRVVQADGIDGAGIVLGTKLLELRIGHLVFGEIIGQFDGRLALDLVRTMTAIAPRAGRRAGDAGGAAVARRHVVVP